MSLGFSPETFYRWRKCKKQSLSSAGSCKTLIMLFSHPLEVSLVVLFFTRSCWRCCSHSQEQMCELIRKCWSAGKQPRLWAHLPEQVVLGYGGVQAVLLACWPAFRVPQQKCIKNEIPGLAQARTYPTGVIRLPTKRLEPNNSRPESLLWFIIQALLARHSGITRILQHPYIFY